MKKTFHERGREKMKKSVTRFKNKYTALLTIKKIHWYQLVCAKANIASYGFQEGSQTSLQHLSLTETGKEETPPQVRRSEEGALSGEELGQISGPPFPQHGIQPPQLCSGGHVRAEEEISGTQGINLVLRSFHKTRAIFKRLQSR